MSLTPSSRERSKSLIINRARVETRRSRRLSSSPYEKQPPVELKSEDEESLDWDNNDSQVTLTGCLIFGENRICSDDLQNSPSSISGIVDPPVRNKFKSLTTDDFLAVSDDSLDSEVFFHAS